MTWPDVFKSWPPLLACVALLVAGSWLYKDDETLSGAALLAGGLVTLGAWLAISIRSSDPIQGQKTQYPDDDPPRRDEA